MLQQSKTALALTVVSACVLLTFAAPATLNDEKNPEGKVAMRFFPGSVYPGVYPGFYPGQYPGFFPGAYPGGYLGGPYGFGYPIGGYPGGPMTFYNNENGKNPSGNKPSPGGRY